MNKEMAWLGVDCGSVGIKLALVNSDKEVVSSTYLRNSGISETLQNGLEEMSIEDYNVRGCGTTGSGRNFASVLVGADEVKPEILAHSIGTLNFYPEVRTIMDIGGEDCKIISVRNGNMKDFEMNAVCGAGTGAVIDSIANRLGVRIEDVGELALSSREVLDFPGKCGVFAQSSVVSRLNAGCEKSDILMGVVRALVSNYLMLGRRVSLEPPFVYQGATSRNTAIVHALEEELGNEVTVPEHASIMGAIGMALYVKEKVNGSTEFKGHNFDERDISLRTKRTDGCENRCEMTYFYEAKKLIGCIGNRCDECIPKSLRQKIMVKEDNSPQENVGAIN